MHDTLPDDALNRNRSRPGGFQASRLAPISVLRAVGYAEGASYLLLLGVAMPLKYLAGLPAMVRYVGWAHGLLFVLFVVAVAVVAVAHRWPVGRISKALLASLLPFGPFVLDREWRREQRSGRGEPTAASGA